MQTEVKERRAVDEFAVAAALGISVHTVRKDRTGARRIPFYRIGTTVRYDLDRVWQSMAATEVGGIKPPSPSKARQAPR